MAENVTMLDMSKVTFIEKSYKTNHTTIVRVHTTGGQTRWLIDNENGWADFFFDQLVFQRRAGFVKIYSEGGAFSEPRVELI